MPYNLAFLSPPFLPHNSAFISLIWLFYFPNKAGNTAEWISSSFAQFVKLRCSLASLLSLSLSLSLSALSTADCIPVVVLLLRWILGHLAERTLLPSLSRPPPLFSPSCNYFACAFCIFQMFSFVFFLVSRRGQRSDCAVGVSPPYSAIAIG